MAVPDKQSSTHDANPAIPGAEFLPLDEVDKIQRERWVRQAEYVNTHSRFYRDLGYQMPSSLDALESVPLTDKEMLREDQRRFPPFGSYLACDEASIRRIHRTSGTPTPT